MSKSEKYIYSENLNALSSIIERDTDNEVCFYIFNDSSVIRENLYGRVSTTRYRVVERGENNGTFITFYDTFVNLEIMFRINDSSSAEWEVYHVKDPNNFLEVFNSYNRNNDHDLYYELRDLWLEDRGPTI